MTGDANAHPGSLITAVLFAVWGIPGLHLAERTGRRKMLLGSFVVGGGDHVGRVDRLLLPGPRDPRRSLQAAVAGTDTSPTSTPTAVDENTTT